MRTVPSLAIVLFMPLALTACQSAPKDGTAQALMSCVPVEKVEVVHFHGTQQCVSCIEVGRLAEETLRERFSNEMELSRVAFREVNGELPENSDIITRYQARGTSLFVNAVSEGQDRIEEDVTVWRLYSNEEQFKQYFEQKIRDLLTCAS